MKITEVRALYPNYRHVAPSWRTHLWQIVVHVETDAGVAGFGYGGGGKASVEVVNGHFRELLLGRRLDSADGIREIWDALYAASLPYGRRGIAVMALSGVDLALWDLLARAERVPVHRLIGGRRKGRVRAYAAGDDVARHREEGFTAHKFPHRWTGAESDYDAAVASASLARATLGTDALVMIDGYMTWTADVVREMARRLEEFDVHWFEDVLTPDDLQEHAALRQVVKPVLIAGGEHEFTHHGFAEVARAGALDVWQPDITWCGGITAGLRIVEMADKAGVPVVPHRGGEVWGLHLIVASDCEDLAEVVLGARGAPRDRLWLGEPEAQVGYIEPDDGPGFGVTVNEALL